MLLTVALPLSLAIIMLSLGIGLTIVDFARVLKMPKAVLAGIAMQIIGLPLLALALLQIFALPPALAFGVMLLAFCPGGVTSNFITKLAGGTVALSITLTAVVSLAAVLTVPIFVSLAAQNLLGEAAPEINVTGIAISMFAITALPVLIGITIRHLAPHVANSIEPILSKLAIALFAIIVIAAVALNWQLFINSLTTLGPALIALNIAALAIGLALSRTLGLTGPDTKATAIELGVQNSTLGITVAGLIAGTAETLPEYALPAGVYGITMYLVTIPAILALRRWLS